MKFFALLTLLLMAGTVSAQSTYTAASCSQADIGTAISAENATPVSGDIIALPTCAVTWTGNTTLRSVFTVNVTIQGATVVTCSGTPGTTGYSCIATDNTAITDHFSGAASRWQPICAAGKTCRMTGITFIQDTTTAPEDGGLVLIQGASGITNWRVDHMHMKVLSGTAAIGVGFGGSGFIQGVGDHNFFEPAVGQTHGLTDTFAVHNGYGWNGTSTTTVNASWAAAPGFGTSAFFFVESNYFHNVDIADVSEGARSVFRYNTDICDVSQTSGCQQFSHTTREGERGDAYREIYGNAYSQSPAASNTVVPFNSGTGLVWGNTVSGYNQIANLDNQRQYSSDFTFQAQPAGLGYCGPAPYATGTASVAANSTAVTGSGFSTLWTGTNSNDLLILVGASCTFAGHTSDSCSIASVGSSTALTLGENSTAAVTSGLYQVGSTWDGNTNVQGYPCLDQPGRSQGDLLSGIPGGTPHLLDSVTGTQIWPNQPLSPIYVWDNTFTPSGASPIVVRGATTNTFANNVDYYMDFGTYGNSGTFNGTVGIGQGLLSARPATCTAGTGLTGVAYWETDHSQLDYCIATNTWSTPTSNPASYTPYQYPHPLVGGGGGSVTNLPASLASITVQGQTGLSCSPTLTNGTSSTISGITFSYTGPNIVDFGFGSGLPCSPTCTTTLAAGASCTYAPTFTPLGGIGTVENATVNIHWTGGTTLFMPISVTVVASQNPAPITMFGDQ